MSVPDPERPAANRDLETERAWAALRLAADQVRRRTHPQPGQTVALAAGRLSPVSAEDSGGLLLWQSPSGWCPAANAPGTARALLDLYLPVCNATPQTPLTVGHLGQSLDGFIATESGDSFYVTGPENLLHLHRMRSLCDAVVVGAETVAADDPRLTTRRASGENPVRVIIDPRRRLPPTHAVFTDEQAETLLVCAQAEVPEHGERIGSVEVLGIPVHADRFDLAALMAALHERGLVAIFVEGGGQTVSAFLEAGLLDRLQIAIAPLITGAGRPGIRLAGRQSMKDCLRPAHRIFSMGDDVLFDCDLRADAEVSGAGASGGLSRIL
jgi:riboflavin-specific deaminase-like protein